MADVFWKLGRVSVPSRGAYDPLETYNRLDIVEYEGSSYLVMADGTSGITPEGGSAYMLPARRGKTGETGPRKPPALLRTVLHYKNIIGGSHHASSHKHRARFHCSAGRI